MRVRKRKEYKSVIINKFQNSVLIGGTIGDFHLGIAKNGFESRLNYAHTIQQKDYVLHKAEIFKDFEGTVGEKEHFDKRTNKTYRSVYHTTKAHPIFTKYQNIFYRNKKKIIPTYISDIFDGVSLAYLFMDDGSITKAGYYISLDSYSIDEIKIMQSMFTHKFKLKCTIHTSNKIYVWSQSVKAFNRIVEPYILDCLRYKLHT